MQQDRLKTAEASVQTARTEWKAAKQKLALIAAAPEETEERPVSPFAFADDFDAANPEVWEVVGDWKFENGTLLRSTSTREREFVRLRIPLPRDFEMTCRYTTTGGDTYKSVTFRFDESSDGTYANYVYTSAHAPGPKVQVAYSRNGTSSYPSQGRKANPVKIGDELNLRIAVRDHLVNVWLNDEFQVAYQLPDRPETGRFTLQGFDATVAYNRIEFRSLPESVNLTPAKNKALVSPEDTSAAVEIAAAKLAAAEAGLESIRATVAADREKFSNQPHSEIADSSPEQISGSALEKQAARSQVNALIAEAKYELVAALGDANKAKAAQAKLSEAKKQLQNIDQQKPAYNSIKASLKALEGPSHNEADYPAVYSRISTGRRTALAKWMTSDQNPLTARVVVNHVWMRHFGEPLVESVFDFGLRAKKPEHLDLLDFLAADFMQHHWSFKRLHRLIVTSTTYQLSSSVINADPSTVAYDPDNTFYWRMNTRRMESQAVRDSLLSLAGTLDLKLGGPSLDVGNSSTRRSLYYKHSRDSQDKFLSMFDDADLLQCYRRSESIVPQQALALANSEVSMQNAADIAARISSSLDAGDLRLFISTAIETLLGRLPVDMEEEYCLAFCEDLEALLQQDKPFSQADLDVRIRSRLVHALINHNDFISIR